MSLSGAFDSRTASGVTFAPRDHYMEAYASSRSSLNTETIDQEPSEEVIEFVRTYAERDPGFDGRAYEIGGVIHPPPMDSSTMNTWLLKAHQFAKVINEAEGTPLLIEHSSEHRSGYVDHAMVAEDGSMYVNLHLPCETPESRCARDLVERGLADFLSIGLMGEKFFGEDEQMRKDWAALNLEWGTVTPETMDKLPPMMVLNKRMTDVGLVHNPGMNRDLCRLRHKGFVPPKSTARVAAGADDGAVFAGLVKAWKAADAEALALQREKAAAVTRVLASAMGGRKVKISLQNPQRKYEKEKEIEEFGKRTLKLFEMSSSEPKNDPPAAKKVEITEEELAALRAEAEKAKAREAEFVEQKKKVEEYENRLKGVSSEQDWRKERADFRASQLKPLLDQSWKTLQEAAKTDQTAFKEAMAMHKQLTGLLDNVDEMNNDSAVQVTSGFVEAVAAGSRAGFAQAEAASIEAQKKLNEAHEKALKEKEDALKEKDERIAKMHEFISKKASAEVAASFGVLPKEGKEAPKRKAEEPAGGSTVEADDAKKARLGGVSAGASLFRLPGVTPVKVNRNAVTDFYTRNGFGTSQ